MNEINYLIFLLHNRLNENYSIRDLRREIEERLQKIIGKMRGQPCPECERIIGTNGECFLCSTFNNIENDALNIKGEKEWKRNFYLVLH